MYYIDVADFIRYERLATHWNCTPSQARKEHPIAQELAFILQSVDNELQEERMKKSSSNNAEQPEQRNKNELNRALQEFQRAGIDPNGIFNRSANS